MALIQFKCLEVRIESEEEEFAIAFDTNSVEFRKESLIDEEGILQPVLDIVNETSLNYHVLDKDLSMTASSASALLVMAMSSMVESRMTELPS